MTLDKYLLSSLKLRWITRFLAPKVYNCKNRVKKNYVLRQGVIFSFLNQCRQLSVSMGSAIKFIKMKLSMIKPNMPDNEVNFKFNSLAMLFLFTTKITLHHFFF